LFGTAGSGCRGDLGRATAGTGPAPVREQEMSFNIKDA